jgi:hypothetical protein
MDLLVLFHVMNEGMVNILQHFFEMSKPDAERTLHIYRTFVKQTDNVVKYLSVARNYEHVTRLEIPTLKHAPTVLTNQLEEYVKDTDFEAMRRQYLAQQSVKKGGKATNGSNKLLETKPSATTTKSEPFPEPKTTAQPAAKGPAPDLIDFFESIEQNQTQMNTNPFQQPQFAQQNVPPQATGFNPQAAFGTQPTGFPGQQAAFGAQQTNITGQQAAFAPQATGIPNQQTPFGLQTAGISNQQSAFGALNPGLPGQQSFSPVQAQSTSNPFAQVQNNPPNSQPLQPNFTGAGFGGYTQQPQPQQNRFTPGLSSIPQNSVSSFQPSPLDTQASTNPFRQSVMPQATGPIVSPLSPQSTNPFAKPQNTSTPPTSNSPFSAPTNQFSNLSLNSSQPTAQPPVLAATGTNPFARPQTSGSPAGGTPFPPSATLTTHVTGSTNPFRQSQFVNQNTGMGWQSGPQGTIGGMHPDQIQTQSVFPRPGGA